MDITMILMMVGIFAAMYFLMIRPQQKQKRQVADMRSSLKVGDEITTIGGMVGKIVQIKEDFVVFETGEDRVRIKIAKWGISGTGAQAQQQQQRR